MKIKGICAISASIAVIVTLAVFGMLWYGQATYSSSGSKSQSQEFLTSGTFTPASGVSLVYVTLVGGGGGGSRPSVNDNGAGGGGGETLFRVPYSVVSGTAYNVTVGHGGRGASPDGLAGGSSKFGNVYVLNASGGFGGINNLVSGNGGGFLGFNTNASSSGYSISGGHGGLQTSGGNSLGFAGGVYGGAVSGGGGGASTRGNGSNSAANINQIDSLPNTGVGGAGSASTAGLSASNGTSGYVLIEWVG